MSQCDNVMSTSTVVAIMWPCGHTGRETRFVVNSAMESLFQSDRPNFSSRQKGQYTEAII